MFRMLFVVLDDVTASCYLIRWRVLLMSRVFFLKSKSFGVKARNYPKRIIDRYELFLENESVKSMIIEYVVSDFYIFLNNSVLRTLSRSSFFHSTSFVPRASGAVFPIEQKNSLYNRVVFFHKTTALLYRVIFSYNLSLQIMVWTGICHRNPVKVQQCFCLYFPDVLLK